MTVLKKRAIAAVLSSVVFYMMFAFVALDWNLAHLSLEGRLFFVICLSFVNGSAVSFPFTCGAGK